MGAGVLIVTTLYVLANVAYLVVLPQDTIAHAPQDRVGTAALQAMFGSPGLYIMAIAIMISTFGCNNGLILSGARVYYAMARDNLFFKSAAWLDPTFRTPKLALIAQAIWTCVLCLSGTYGQLLNFVIFAAVVFYAVTAIALFRLRKTRPDIPRPVRAPGYPVLPALYVALTGRAQTPGKAASSPSALPRLRLQNRSPVRVRRLPAVRVGTLWLNNCLSCQPTGRQAVHPSFSTSASAARGSFRSRPSGSSTRPRRPGWTTGRSIRTSAASSAAATVTPATRIATSSSAPTMPARSPTPSSRIIAGRTGGRRSKGESS